jgi:hypothetical protein
MAVAAGNGLSGAGLGPWPVEAARVADGPPRGEILRPGAAGDVQAILLAPPDRLVVAYLPKVPR